MLLRLLQVSQFTEFITHSTYFHIVLPITSIVMLLRIIYRKLLITLASDVKSIWSICSKRTADETLIQERMGMFNVQCGILDSQQIFNISPSSKAYHVLNLVDLFLVGANMTIYLSLRHAVIRASVPLVRGLAAAIRIMLSQDTNRNISGQVVEKKPVLPLTSVDESDVIETSGLPKKGDSYDPTYQESKFNNTLFNIAQIIEKSTYFNVQSAAPTLEEIAVQMLTEKTMLYKEALFCYTVPEVIKEIDGSLDMMLDGIVNDLRCPTLKGKDLLKKAQSDFNTIEQLKISRTRSMLLNNSALKSHATVRFATIMFCDIKGFTSLSDKMPLTHLLQLLEQFFEIVCDETERYNGKLGAYLGDGVMCIWEASSSGTDKSQGLDGTSEETPHIKISREIKGMSHGEYMKGIDQPSIGTVGSSLSSTFGSSMHRSLAFSSTSSSQFFNSSLVRAEHVRESINNACLTAFAILRRIQKSEFPDVRKLDCRFGINAGDCVVGVFGCSKRLNYTAISDTVNVASRIETATRIFNSKVLIHSNCVQYLGPKIKSRRVGQIEAKGKLEPLSLYEIVEASPKYQVLVDITMQLQLLYEAGKIFDCLRLCYETLEKYPGDEILKTYTKKCIAELKNPQIYAPF